MGLPGDRAVTFLESITLGALQGLTEFLPVSSSGHLVLMQSYMGIDEPVIFFDVLLHTGTLGAVLVFFNKEVAAICRDTAAALSRSNRLQNCLMHG